jgi:ribosomal-protein-alanine N-acetyltransferase
MSNTPVIQPLSIDQASLLAEIHAASFGGAAWSLEQIKGSLTLETTQGWMALKGDRAQGFILCQMGSEQVEILTFGVHPSAQRLGIGEALVQKVTTVAALAGALNVFLEVAADNHAARALYEKLGFRTSGLRKGYYRSGTTAVDAMFYKKTLKA